MATSSTFTTAHRRKKLATYGKASRPVPTFSWDDDAPSPERPRKQAGRPGAASPVSTAAAEQASRPKSPAQKSLVASTTRDIFDVPSDDDTRNAATPVRATKTVPKAHDLKDGLDGPFPTDGLHKQKAGEVPALRGSKQQSQSRSPALSTKANILDVFDLPSSDDERVVHNRPAKRPFQTLPMSIERTLFPALRTSANAVPPQSTIVEQPALARKRGRTPQVEDLLNRKLASGAGKKPASKTRAPPAKPALQASVSRSNNKPRAPKAEPTTELDIFDVPSSDEDEPLTTTRRVRPAPLQREKTPPIDKEAPAQQSPSGQTESDESSTAKKRKRQAPKQLSHVGTMRSVKECVLPQKSARIKNNEDRTSPGDDSSKQSDTSHIPTATANDPAVNKSKRTRLRTVSNLQPASITKGQSSPARLHTMLAVRSMSRPQNQPTLPRISEPVLLEDETMYDIMESANTPGDSSRSHQMGLVTPRQKQMFSNLLGDSSDSKSPTMPSISRLRLTDRPPAVRTPTLNRSSSDVPQSTSSRKPRLIDTLIQAVPDAIDSGDDYSESLTGEETEEDIAINSQTSRLLTASQQSTSRTADDMYVDQQQPASQPSQSAVHTNGSAKITYAKQRSYLDEETTLEDPLFLTMGLDDAPDFSNLGQKKTFQPVSDDEDDPASQVRGIHELRRKGQNERFQMEIQTAIDDISDNAGLGPSVRRAALLELCTKMAEGQFLEQFLDSSLVKQFLNGLASKGEVIFDFAALVAVAFIVTSGPEYTILEQIFRSCVMPTLAKLLDLDADIDRIAKERKTNLSKVGRESVSKFRTLVRDAPLWSDEDLIKVSPQIIALQTLEKLLLGLRKAGNSDALANAAIISKVLMVSSGPCDRLKAGNATSQDHLILKLAFSVLETVSMGNSEQNAWSDGVLRRLVQMLPAFFDASGSSPIKLAIRLCMNLTNNKPTACDIFAGQDFIQPLMKSVDHRFASLASNRDTDQRTDVLETLVLSLGVMINLAEFSDQARLSVLAGEQEQLVSRMVEIFLEGSERAAQADSLEKSEANVAIGYLAVFLGNACLNDIVRKEVQSRLPHKKMDMLFEGINEFIRFNERVDREHSQFEGEEGRETWHNFTTRLMLVVERLQGTQLGSMGART